MKNLIKELCKREGKKKQVAIGDVREIMARLADILVSTDDSVAGLSTEFTTALAKKAKGKVTLTVEYNKKKASKK